MSIASNDWFEQMKYHVETANNQNLYVMEGIITSRQLDPPSVKVMLQPYGVETGWIKIGVPYGGNGFGFLAIPPENQVVKVIFDMAHKGSAAVVCDMYNEVDLPPSISKIDDVVFVHKSGSKVYFHDNGDVEVVAASSGQIKFAGGGPAVARVGDAVQVSGTDSHGDTFTATGTITSGSSKVQSG